MPTPTDLLSPIVVEFPLRGEWVAGHTPAERIPSHGTDLLGQRYAYDFLRIENTKSSWKFFRAPLWRYWLFGVTLDNCHGWGETICAPFDGTVVNAKDGWPERNRLHPLNDFFLVLTILLRHPKLFGPKKPQDLRPALGNYIILKMQQHEVYALFAHARPGSIQVRDGDSVRLGRPLAQVGHSGNSTAPHLHFHLMNNPDIIQAQGLLCCFKHYQRRTEHGWQNVTAGIPGLREFIRYSP